MKIAYVITRGDAVGGATIHVRDLARAMLDRGHEPLILVGGNGPATVQLEAAGATVRRLRHLHHSLHPVRDPLAIAELRSALREFAPELVSVHTAKAGWTGRAAARLLRLPVIYTPHGLPLSGRFSPAAGWLFTMAERAAAGWSSAIVCVSESEREAALTSGITAPDRLFLIHNGVRDVPPEFRARPEWEPARICAVARFERPKDFPTLIEALSLLKDRQWTLDVVGDGPLKPEIRRLAARFGIVEQIRFLGYQADPAPVLAHSQIFVLASLSEAFPRSILEAMRAGLPVAATDVGGVREAVSHGETGFLVPLRDAGALAAAIAALRAAPDLRRELGARARSVFERRFRLEYTVEKILALYSQVTGKCL